MRVAKPPKRRARHGGGAVHVNKDRRPAVVLGGREAGERRGAGGAGRASAARAVGRADAPALQTLARRDLERSAARESCSGRQVHPKRTRGRLSDQDLGGLWPALPTARPSPRSRVDVGLAGSRGGAVSCLQPHSYKLKGKEGPPPQEHQSCSPASFSPSN